MIYGISIITTTGYPYYNKDYAIEPRNTMLKNLFFNYSKIRTQSTQETEFDLIAGLVSALFNFSFAQNRTIDELIYSRPEFEVEDLLDGETTMDTTVGTLITVRCESYSIKTAVKRKLDYIHEKMIAALEPLNEKTNLAPSEEKLIHEILLSVPSKQLIRGHSKDLDTYLKKFIATNQTYGIRAVAITSSDLTILKTVGITDENFQKVLRAVECPEVEPLTWKFRQAWAENNEGVTLVFINSAYNVTTETLQEPIYYLLLCDAYSALGDLPRSLFMDLNNILAK